jgi:hypothetical protein
MEAADPAATRSRFDIRGIETEACARGHVEVSDPQPTDGGQCDENPAAPKSESLRGNLVITHVGTLCRRIRVVCSFDAWIAPLDRESAGDDPSWRPKGARWGEASVG